MWGFLENIQRRKVEKHLLQIDEACEKHQNGVHNFLCDGTDCYNIWASEKVKNTRIPFDLLNKLQYKNTKNGFENVGWTK